MEARRRLAAVGYDMSPGREARRDCSDGYGRRFALLEGVCWRSKDEVTVMASLARSPARSLTWIML